MVSYSNSNAVQYLRQYEMFANSLKLVKEYDQREMIIRQLSKLEHKILDATNEIYQEEYESLVNKECSFLDEERARITLLIDLINQRLSYVEKRLNDHYQLTGETIDVDLVPGADMLDSLEDRVKIIDKYSKNVKLREELDEEVKSLTSKITLASEKIEINNSLNIELEAKFKETITNAIEKLGLYDLLDKKELVEYACMETEKSLTLAELNLEAAKTTNLGMVDECEKILLEVKEDYALYKDQLSILKLMEMFNREVNDYDELVDKRREVNDLFRYIKNEQLIALVSNLVESQYNTIIREKQDVNTYNDLVLEKERKLETILRIDEENNSEKFQSILTKLIENEKKRQEKIMEEKRLIEEEEKKKRAIIERKRQEEILKRQRVIEETRKKEIEKRTKELLEQQQKSVLQQNKKKVSFDTIKDRSNDSEIVKEEVLVENEANNSDISVSKDTLIKNRVDIEKELFDEFNSSNVEKKDNSLEIDDSVNKFPEMSLDEYMKNFDENKVLLDEASDMFTEDFFPNIPI